MTPAESCWPRYSRPATAACSCSRLFMAGVRAVKAASWVPPSEIILLAVTGMSPAVLTETVCTLAKETPPVIPNRVVVITTAAGQQCIQKELFAPVPEYNGECVWDALRAALKKLGGDLTGK